MLNLSLNALKLVAKSRGIKDYKNMSKEKLLCAFSKSESVRSEYNFDNARIKMITEDFSKLREIFKFRNKRN